MGILGKLIGKKKEEPREMMLSIPHSGTDIMSSFFPPTEDRTDMSEVIDKLNIKDGDPQLLAKLSELNQRQIMAVTILRSASKAYKINCLQEILDEFMQLMISKRRLGRREIIDLFGKAQQQQPPMFLPQGSNAMSKYKG